MLALFFFLTNWTFLLYTALMTLSRQSVQNALKKFSASDFFFKSGAYTVICKSISVFFSPHVSFYFLNEK